MYLVFATLGLLQFNRLSTFCCKKKKEKVHDLKLKEKICKSLWFEGKGRIHITISLETSSALDKF